MKEQKDLFQISLPSTLPYKIDTRGTGWRTSGSIRWRRSSRRSRPSPSTMTTSCSHSPSWPLACLSLWLSSLGNFARGLKQMAWTGMDPVRVQWVLLALRLLLKTTDRIMIWLLWSIVTLSQTALKCILFLWGSLSLKKGDIVEEEERKQNREGGRGNWFVHKERERSALIYVVCPKAIALTLHSWYVTWFDTNMIWHYCFCGTGLGWRVVPKFADCHHT